MTKDIMGEYDSSYGMLAFYYYCDKTKSEIIIAELLKKGNINYQVPSKNIFRTTNESLFGCTALHIAVIKKDYKNFKLLIDNGADYTIKNGNGDTVIHVIIEKIYADTNNLTEYKKFLDLVLSAHMKFENYSNPQNNHGISHFHAACMTSRTKLVKFFLKNGASVNEAVDAKSEVYARYTPLHFAARFGNLLIAKMLLNRGADVRCKDAQGLTALHHLIKRNMEIVDWVNMGKRDCYDHLKKEFEQNEKIIPMIMAKIQSGVNEDSWKLSHLHVASTLQDTSMIEQLCKEKANLNEPLHEKSSLWSGYTPLHFAAHFNAKSVKLLLCRGADFLIKNTEGLTPFDLCLQRYDVEVLDYLIKSVSTWKGIKFCNTEISLSKLFSTMKNGQSFSKFLTSLNNINMSIPLTSPIFPGFTLLHLLVSLSERHQVMDDISNDRFHKLNDDEDVAGVHFNCSTEDEKIYLKRIKRCLELGADVAAADSNGSTPLHVAFKLQKQSAVSLLLDCYEGKDDIINKDKLSYLHIACAAGNKTVVENLLLASNKSVNRAVTTRYKYNHTIISAGSTPLHTAVATRNTEIVKLLILHAADVYAQDSNGLTPLHQIFVQAIEDKEESTSLNEIASILLFSEDLQECETNFGLSHLHVATWTKKGDAIERLLINGANIDATISFEKLSTSDQLKCLKNFDGFTPLHLALKNECEEMIESLVRRGANVLAVPLHAGYEFHVKNSDFLAGTLIDQLIARKNIKNKFGLTSLHAACAKLDVQRVKKLLSQRADPNAQVDSNSPLWPGDTPLHFVFVKRNDYPMEDLHSIINLLLNFGANVTLANMNNCTAVYRAYNLNLDSNGTFLFPWQLLHAHTDFTINPTNNEGFSHFHIACVRNQVHMVEEFLKQGTNVNQTVDFASHNFPGCSALHLAALAKFDDIVDLLLEYGADVHKRNIGYRNPIHEAASRLAHLQQPSERAILSLIKIGKELQSQTIMNETPLELLLFRKKSTTDTFRLLLESKDRVNLFNSARGEGFIAIAISHDNSIEELLENTYFAAVLNAPEANGPDEMGRTPIHNVVSLRKSAAPIEVHFKALHKLTEVGFDINQQDAAGQTALHLAVHLFNYKGLAALLHLGADINIADNKGETPLSPVAKQFQQSYSDTTESQRKILQICLGQINKMKDTELHISRINISMEEAIHKYWKFDSDMKAIWRSEKEKMANEKIDSQTLRLSHFLSETGAVSLYPKLRPPERQNIDKFFQTNTDKIFQEYSQFGGLLLLQHRKAQARVDLLKIARISLRRSTNYILTDVCCDIILQYYTNEQLKILNDE